MSLKWPSCFVGQVGIWFLKRKKNALNKNGDISGLVLNFPWDYLEWNARPVDCLQNLVPTQKAKPNHWVASPGEFNRLHARSYRATFFTCVVVLPKTCKHTELENWWSYLLKWQLNTTLNQLSFKLTLQWSILSITFVLTIKGPVRLDETQHCAAWHSSETNMWT